MEIVELNIIVKMKHLTLNAGMVYLPMYDVPRRLSTDTTLSPDQSFLQQIAEVQAQNVASGLSVIKNNNKGAYENVTIRHSKC